MFCTFFDNFKIEQLLFLKWCLISGNTVLSQHWKYQKNILQHLIFLVKMKLVSTVWFSTSLRKLLKVTFNSKTVCLRLKICRKYKWYVGTLPKEKNFITKFLKFLPLFIKSMKNKGKNWYLRKTKKADSNSQFFTHQNGQWTWK